MKIVVAMHSFYGQSVGGAEYQSYLIAKELIKNGHDVHYLYLSNGKPIKEKHEIKLQPLKRISHIKGGFFEIPMYYFRISRLLKKLNPDIIYTRRRSAVSIICAFFARLHNVKSIFHIAHDNDLAKYKFKIFSKNILKLPEQVIFFKFAIFLFNKIISQTHYQSEHLYQNYRLYSYLIPNGHPKSTCTTTHDNDKQVIIMWVANMRPIKQPELFLKLAIKIGNKDGNTFLMIGRPPGGLKQKAFIEKINRIPNISYLGEIHNDKVNEYLCKAHIFVNTSLAEGFSNTFIQSWMRKVPVVSLNVDPDNIIKNEGIGFHSGCFDQMVKDVKALIKDHRLRMMIGNKAHQYAIENHSIQNIRKVADLIVS